jgi:peptidoglycan hydrolase-like protein with peptidoglycan-binding domain
VKDGSDPNLLALLTMALMKDPALQSTQLGKDVMSGHVTQADIKILQQELQSKGYSCGKCGVDGKYGPDTNGALEAFLNGDPPSAPGSNTPSTCPSQNQPQTPPPMRRHHPCHAEPLMDAGPDMDSRMPDVQYA